MNQEQLTSLVRQLILAAGGGLVTHGVFTGDNWALIASGLAALVVGGAWALYTRRPNGLVASAADQTGVQSIVATPAIAAAVAHDKVTS